MPLRQITQSRVSLLSHANNWSSCEHVLAFLESEVTKECNSRTRTWEQRTTDQTEAPDDSTEKKNKHERSDAKKAQFKLNGWVFDCRNSWTELFSKCKSCNKPKETESDRTCSQCFETPRAKSNLPMLVCSNIAFHLRVFPTHLPFSKDVRRPFEKSGLKFMLVTWTLFHCSYRPSFLSDFWKTQYLQWP